MNGVNGEIVECSIDIDDIVADFMKHSHRLERQYHIDSHILKLSGSQMWLCDLHYEMCQGHMEMYCTIISCKC